MTKTILYECFNLSLPSGTGIKTYARNLAGAARDLGFKVEALIQSARPLSPDDPFLSEISVHDVIPKRNWRQRFLHDPLQLLIGAPFGQRAFPLGDQGFVMSQGEGVFSRRHAAHQFILKSRRHFARYGKLATMAVDGRPDLFHLTHPVPLRVKGAPLVCTIHDVIPLRLPGATLDNKRQFLRTVRALCREADHIVTVSDCSRRDILTVTGMDPARVSVTYQSVSFPAMDLARSAEENERILNNIFGLDTNGYYLFFGALEPKKNVSRLIDAYAASGASAPLVIAGGLGWNYKDDVERIEDERHSSWRIANDRITRERQVRRLDHVPFTHLIALIKGARAVLFPSLYEGFGLPVLEAMALGAPVMTSNVSSLPEVAGEAALCVDPYDIDGMARAIRSLDADADLRAELSRRGLSQAERFSPEIYRSRVQDVYRKLL
jgi:glycosyltransferase involved in cell wall biosynthesis